MSKEHLDCWLYRNRLIPKNHNNSSFINPPLFYPLDPDRPNKIKSIPLLICQHQPYSSHNKDCNLTKEEQRCNILYHSIVSIFLFIIFVGMFVFEISIISVGLIGFALFVAVIPTIEGGVNDKKPRNY